MNKIFLILALACFVANASTFPPLVPYLTPHFSNWLNENGYGNFSFERYDIVDGGSYGGKSDSSDTILNDPVIFIHGNSDQAIGDTSDEFDGFTSSIQYFLSQGYKESELYATTWGPANVLMATQQYHSYYYLNYLRNFVEAVLAYTGAEKIDIIAHSMGVTLGRKVILGGTGVDGTPYDLGKSLASYVDTFLGIAGANWGLVECYTAEEFPTCGDENGFYPGITYGIGLSTYLQDLNSDSDSEADYVASMLSTADNVILYGDLVYGQYTSQIPGEDGCKIYDDLTHMGLKSQTCPEQLQIITQHKI